ncbi:MAG: outer membrane lipoprotein chaperone LolA [Steroidobacteraceae bacterium]
MISTRTGAALRRLTLALTLAVGTLAAARAHASAASDVERYLGGLSSWSADFSQTIEDGQGKVLRSASGKFYLQRPGKFRWDYAEPSQQLVLGDGQEIWFYDKDLQQANVRSMDATLASTPAVLLSGTGSVAAQFDIKALPDEGGLRWFQLLPKHPDTDFQLVRIGFDKDGELASMFLADKLNQITQLTFTHPVKNPKLIPDLFTFSPPPGVDVIGRDSK